MRHSRKCKDRQVVSAPQHADVPPGNLAHESQLPAVQGDARVLGAAAPVDALLDCRLPLGRDRIPSLAVRLVHRVHVAFLCESLEGGGADGLYAFLLLPPDDVEEVGLQSLAQVVVLVRIGGEQRCHQSRPVHPGDGLHKMLEEVHDPLPRDLVHARLPARVHQHLIDQNQGAKVPLRRDGQQIHEQRFGGRRLALFVLAVGVDRAQTIGARKLKREHAPRMLQGARLAVRRADPVNAPFHVDLVEACYQRREVALDPPV